MSIKRESCYSMEQTGGKLEVNKLFYKRRMSDNSMEKLKLY